MSIVRRRIRVRGRVQGVGFRYFVASVGRNLDLLGSVRNEVDGDVSIEVQGEAPAVEQFLVHVRRGPALARVTECSVADLPPGDDLAAFAIER